MSFTASLTHSGRAARPESSPPSETPSRRGRARSGPAAGARDRGSRGRCAGNRPPEPAAALERAPRIRARGSRYRRRAWCAGRGRPAGPQPSQASTEWRNDATMIAIAAISEKLATMAARLTAACPGAARNCASASARPGIARQRHRDRKRPARKRGIRQHADQEQAGDRRRSRRPAARSSGPSCASPAPAARRQGPGRGELRARAASARRRT